MSEEKDLRRKSMGPFAPPMPKVAEEEEKEPMAVARDKETYHQSFLPTSAPLDQFDEDVARKMRPDLPHGDAEPKSEKETERMQNPPGYTKTDERGYQHLDADEVDENY